MLSPRHEACGLCMIAVIPSARACQRNCAVTAIAPLRFALACALGAIASCRAPSSEHEKNAAVGTVASPIVGGRISNAYAAVGNLNINNAFSCTGTLISKRVVLTAAHCVSLFFRDELATHPPVWFFPNEGIDREPIRAERVVVRSNTECLFTTTGRDLAYIVLEKDVSTITPMPVARTSHEGRCGHLALGYGRSTIIENVFGDGGAKGVVRVEPLCDGADARPPSATPLTNAERPVVPFGERKELDVCNQGALSPNGYIDTNSASGSVCVGDSGGPLIDVRSGRIVGVAAGNVVSANGVVCEPGSITKYTPVATHLDFIDEALAISPPPTTTSSEPDAEDGCQVSASPRQRAPTSSAFAAILFALFLLRRRRPSLHTHAIDRRNQNE